MENPLMEIMPLASCQKCFDTGILLNAGKIVDCPILQTSPNEHYFQNPASFIFTRAARRLNDMDFWINPRCFELARILTHYESVNPCTREALIHCFFEELGNLRQFHNWIEELRKNWLLPIGSRKDAPSGYWIITKLEDFKEWVDRAKSAPITQLSTIHSVAKHNFPKFAEQLELDFWKDFGGKNDR